MIKHLQTYNKQILAVVSMLLLVVFLAPTLVTRCGGPSASSGTVYATLADGTKLTLGELADMRGQLAVLEMLQDPTTRQLGVEKSPEHWWLLVREARAAGLVGGSADGRAFIDAAAAQRGVTPDQMLAQVAGSARQPATVVLETLANLRGVERLIGITLGGRALSDARSRVVARELLADVECEVVPIDGATVGDRVPVDPPTAERLTAMFEKGKSKLPGTGPGGIGYKWPDRVKFEWIALPQSILVKTVSADPALGAVELRKEFRRDPAKFGVPAAELAPGMPSPPFEPYAAKVRESVERRLVKEKVERIGSFVRDWTRASVKDLPAESGIVKLPADWATRGTLATLAPELMSRFGLPLPPIDSTGANWMTLAEIDAHPALSRGTISEFGKPMRIAAAIRAMREFDPESRIPVQPGVVGPVAPTPTDDLFIWRVTETDPSHDPASLDEVRDAVMQDAVSEMRYEKLAAMTDQLAARAAEGGLDDVAKEWGTTVEKAIGVHLADMQMLGSYGIRFAGSLPKAGQDPEAIKAVVRKAVALPTDRPLDTLPQADRIVVVPVPGKFSVLVVRLSKVTTVFLEDYRGLAARGVLAQAAMQDEPKPDLPALFGTESMQKRTGFTLANPEGPDRVMAEPAPQF
jgi:hypothetical protein